MKKLILCLTALSYAATASGQSVDLGSVSGGESGETSQAQEADNQVEKALSDIYESGLADQFGPDSVLTPSEKRQLMMKIRAIKKESETKTELYPYIQKLSDINSDQALDRYIQQRNGFTADQWKEIRKIESNIEKAKNENIGNVKIRIREETLDNGSVTPIEIKVVKGYATAIVFVDANGKPWPIKGDVTGDASAYTSKVSLDHVAIIDNIKEFQESNALINLVGVNIPIVLRLVSNKEVSDSRVIVHLPQLGPNSDQTVEHDAPSINVSPDMSGLLNSGAIGNAREFGFEEIPGTVYYKDNWMYIRTKLDLMIPQPKDTAISPTGYKAYQIAPANTFLFRDENGKRVRASLSKERDVGISYQTSLFEN